jgi:hypothetical protein
MSSARFCKQCSVAKRVFPVNARNAALCYLLRQFGVPKAIMARA